MGHCRCRKSQVARRKDAKYCRHKPPSPAPAPSKLPPNSLQMEMAKYQGWRGVQGNFRGKVEERVQQKGNRRGEGRGAGCGSNYRSQKKTKKRWKGILKEEVAK